MSMKKTSGQQRTFQLVYRSLEGYANLLGRKVEKRAAVHSADYVLRACIFNNTCKKFEGRFHDSMPCRLVDSLQTGAVICPIEQVVFFYCCQCDPTLLLVVELSALFSSGSVQQRVCLGWSILPLFDRRGSVTRGGKSLSVETVRLAVYEGGPRALFSLTHPTGEDKKELVCVPGCILTVSLCPHPTLLKATPLIPPNTLVSLDDNIPGLAHTKALEAFPKLLKTNSGTFEKVSLLLLPSVEDFEEQLLSAVTEDLTAAGASEVCPDQESCVEDPCLNATCPQYPQAICHPNNCNKTCQPSFFRKHNLHKEITHLCNATTCTGMRCPKNRICIEEMVPTVCHHRHHKCEHHIRPRCFLKPLYSPPTNCSIVECPASTDCVTIYASNGTRVDCVKKIENPKKEKDCSELAPCDKGMVCKVKAGTALCAPKHSRKNLQNCAGVKCEEGFVCAVLGKRHVKSHCIREESATKICSELNCQALNMSCIQRSNDGPAVCVSVHNKH